MNPFLLILLTASLILDGDELRNYSYSFDELSLLRQEFGNDPLNKFRNICVDSDGIWIPAFIPVRYNSSLEIRTVSFTE